MLEKSVIRKNNAETAMTIHPRKSAVNNYYLGDKWRYPARLRTRPNGADGRLQIRGD